MMDFLHYAAKGAAIIAPGFGAIWIAMRFLEEVLSSKTKSAIRLAILRSVSELFDRISSTSDRQAAPRGLLIDMCMPPDRAEDVLYNLLGRYDHWLQVHGRRWARIIFHLQSAGSILTFWSDWLLKRAKLLKMFVSN